MSDPMSASESLEDYRKMREVLERGAPSLYRYHGGTEVARVFDSGEVLINRAITPLEFWKVVAPIVASRGDAHMALMLSDQLNAVINGPAGRALPLRIRIVDGKLIVARSYVQPGPQAGSEITSINGIATADLLQACGRAIPIDGSAELRRLRKIEGEFDYWCGSFLGFPGTYKLEVRPAGTPMSVAMSVQPITWDSLKRAGNVLFPKDPPGVAKPPFELTLLENGKVAVMTLRTFSKQGDFDPDKAFDSSFVRLRKAGTTDLIIDIRGNGGGRDLSGARLFSYVTADTFHYASQRIINQKRFAFLNRTDDWMINFMTFTLKTRRLPDGRLELDMPIDHVQHGREPRFSGRLFVLTDARTFSTASEFASLVKWYKRGTIVGEETGNAYGGDSGATVSYVLKNSGLVVNIPMAMYYLPSARRTGADRSVQPDVPVSGSVDDVVAGRDAVRAKAQELIRQSP